jgi:hypothetical protein
MTAVWRPSCFRPIRQSLLRSVESILKTSLDKQDLPESSSPGKPIVHYNIRGREYYQQKEGGYA